METTTMQKSPTQIHNHQGGVVLDVARPTRRPRRRSRRPKVKSTMTYSLEQTRSAGFHARKRGVLRENNPWERERAQGRLISEAPFVSPLRDD